MVAEEERNLAEGFPPLLYGLNARQLRQFLPDQFPRDNGYLRAGMYAHFPRHWIKTRHRRRFLVTL